MRFHWVSQNKTGNEEVAGGYMWCPKSNKNGTRNPNYEMMRNAQPGDLVFSFRNMRITHIGVVVSECFEARKPVDFGERGNAWADIGWKVLVEYETVPSGVIPAMHMDVLRPLLPSKYSPLQNDGRGNQMYFTTLPEELGLMLLSLASFTPDMVRVLVLMVEGAIDRSSFAIAAEAEEIRKLDAKMIVTKEIPETQKQALINARIGQGTFRDAVFVLEPRCRITKVDDPKFLRASHIKPWRVSNDQERLDGHNGLMLAPNVDLLFDQGYITFESSGELMTSPRVASQTWQQLGIPHNQKFNAGGFSREQQQYLEYHRSVLFRAV